MCDPSPGSNKVLREATARTGMCRRFFVPRFGMRHRKETHQHEHRNPAGPLGFS